MSDAVFVAFVCPLSEPVRRFSSCSTDFSQQIAQVVLFLFLYVFFFKTRIITSNPPTSFPPKTNKTWGICSWQKTGLERVKLFISESVQVVWYGVLVSWIAEYCERKVCCDCMYFSGTCLPSLLCPHFVFLSHSQNQSSLSCIESVPRSAFR
jgi:hypothetical protein